MRMTRHALAAVVAASVFGSVTCNNNGSAPVPHPSDGGAVDLLYWLVEVANRTEEPGAYTHPCPHGGEIAVLVKASEGQGAGLYGMWKIEFDECGPGGDPRGPYPEFIYGKPTIPDGHLTFTSSEDIHDELGRKRLEVAVEAEFTWVWNPSWGDRLYSCNADLTDISGVFEAGLDEPYTGSLEGVICGYDSSDDVIYGDSVKIPVSEFPRRDLS